MSLPSRYLYIQNRYFVFVLISFEITFRVFWDASVSSRIVPPIPRTKCDFVISEVRATQCWNSPLGFWWLTRHLVETLLLLQKSDQMHINSSKYVQTTHHQVHTIKNLSNYRVFFLMRKKNRENLCSDYVSKYI